MSSKSFSSTTSNPFNGSRSKAKHGFWDKLYLASTLGAVLTYTIDLILDIILAGTYFSDGNITYGIITLCFVIISSIIVQVFSVRWHQMDDSIGLGMSRPLWIAHTFLMGVLHRYFVVIDLYKEAIDSGDDLDYQRFYQQQSDVCMLRLFDSFGESAPQLIFYLYVIIENGHWSTEKAAWTGISAVSSIVSLGWGIAAYSSAMRMTREDKGKMTWAGMITQALWRAGMLTARIVALVMLSLAVNEWAFLVLFIHWLLMTTWVIFQETDFCPNPWEERLYNAVVGVIYCFCFFNLKEGRSRYRASLFYSVIIFENLAFLGTFYLMKEDVYDPQDQLSYFLVTSAFTIVLGSMTLGLTSMMIYYRFFHPAGPIRPCIGDSVDFESDLAELKKAGKLSPYQRQQMQTNQGDQGGGGGSPDFVVYSQEVVTGNSSPDPVCPPRRRVNYSRSFKKTCSSLRRSREASNATVSPEAKLAEQVAAISPISNRQYRERAIDCGGNISPVIMTTQPQDRVDSAYGTDSNRTGSPPQKGNLEASPNSSTGTTSSSAFNNDTYMNINEAAEVANEVMKHEKSDEKSYMSVHVHRNSDQSDSNQLLKRSPVVRDVTSGFAQISSTSQLMQKRKMTILVPASLDKTISLEALNPTGKNHATMANSFVSNHDYENMALININRNTDLAASGAGLLGGNGNNRNPGVSHWRSYSNMADGKHDESSAYERQPYYDIYPLSKEMKEQLYRSLTPLSTAATCGGSESVASNDTYEPIENYDYGPVTLIHHDGDKLSTRRITSMESLREVIKIHEKVPMDDPQDRPDLYILAPMRLLSPIMEESAMTNATNNETKNNATNAGDLNKSLMTVISDILTNNSTTYASASSIYRPNGTINQFKPVQQNPTDGGQGHGSTYAVAAPSLMCNNQNQNNPDGYFQDSIESQSSLVHTIEEIRNNSLCNLYYATPKKGLNHEVKSQNMKAAPQVPPRNEDQPFNSGLHQTHKVSTHIVHSRRPSRIVEEPQIEDLNSPVKNQQSSKTTATVDDVEGCESESPQFREIQERRQKSALYTSVGSRKNLLDLAGTTKNILNTPKKISPAETTLSILIDPSKLQKEFDKSALRPFENSHSLSPSAKYDTPTPPLKTNQFVRNAYRPRRKFSMLREKFEEDCEPAQFRQEKEENQRPQQQQQHRPMILAKRKNDLYENISDDFLSLRSNSMRAKAERLAKCKSVPSFINSFNLTSASVSEANLLRPDQGYGNSLGPDEQYVSSDDGFMRRRNQWSTASYQRPPNVPAVPLPAFSASMASNQMGPPPFGSNSSRPPSIPSRHSHARRSMSILDDKENCNPHQFLPPKPKPNSGLKDHTKGKQVLPNNPALGGLQQQPRLSKIKSIEPVMLPRGSPKGYRLSTGASLSPHSKIFSAPRT